MSRRVRSFRATKEVDEYLDEMGWGEKSSMINKAILLLAKDGAPTPSGSSEGDGNSPRDADDAEPAPTPKIYAGGGGGGNEDGGAKSGQILEEDKKAHEHGEVLWSLFRTQPHQPDTGNEEGEG